MTHPRGLLVLAFGGPHKSEDIRPFLRHVLTGRPVSDARFEGVVQHYELLGGKSPITEHTQNQARALKQELSLRGIEFDVRVGMRHWTPWIKDTLLAFRNAGITDVLGLIMAAQETEASASRYIKAVEAARVEIGEHAPRVRYVHGWGLSEGVIDAHACHVAQTLSQLDLIMRSQASHLFSAHSIPTPMANASLYVAQLTETAARVAQKVGIASHRLIYQSRSGNPNDPWLEPDVLEALETEARSGFRDVVITPIGFLCDHVEVLYDLDVEARAKAALLGLRLHRVATPGQHPAFIRALADAVQAEYEDAS